MWRWLSAVHCELVDARFLDQQIVYVGDLPPELLIEALLFII